MQAIPEDIQILFGEDESIQANSEGTSVDTREHADWHQDQYPAYQPPHRRGHNVGEDKFVNFKNRDPKKGPDPDKVEGVDNDKYQRLKLPVPFALDRKKLAKLKSDFPGVYFHCKDNGNHDHQFSHVVTMIGTRLMQRRIKPGSVVLDVYGNANACDRFNGTQANAANPKQMKALHFRCGPSDFIREVNKWGPFLDEAGDQRFHRGTLGDMTRSGDLSRYNVLQFVHTLYYQDFTELTQALHSPCDAGTRVAYALIHRHKGNRGYINDGEQSYEKKTVFDGRKLVRQTNLATNSTYTHADLSDILFKQNKTWFPNEDAVNGLTWECHLVNEETWVIEIVPYVLEELRDDIVDYDALWDADEDLETETNGVETPPTPKSGIEFKDNYVIIPTSDGQTVRAEIVNPKLFGVLRAACVGKDRTRATLDELVRLAKHNVNPSAMFGDKEGMHCPEDKIFDHALAAYFVDLDHESRLMEAASTLRPVLMDHASKMNFGPKIRDFSIADLMGICRCVVTFGRQVNAVTRSKDPVDKGLEYLGNALA